ncbi:spore coat protein CotJB [Paenibacillus sp. GCM10027626]|uniref:spore coat protein CotJB n=1 Tax=Paenibacillus sp. GCM10027626 TaxID=3273411 RepID=UPI003633451A
MSHKQLDEQYYVLLEQLQQLEFALVDLTLYLDTHPGDSQAVQQFNQIAQQRQQCAHQFESLYGPLMQFGHSFSKYPWQWVETPWPWQV